MEDIIERKISNRAEAPVLEFIERRRSLRAFAAEQVEAEKVSSLFEAARWAPSSMNEQPWTYIYATTEQRGLHTLILESLNDSNRVWAYKAPLLIVSLARKKLVRNGHLNGAARYDVGAANAFLSLQATALGLIVHQMGGFNREKLIQNLGINLDEYEPIVIMAVGYPGDPESLPENLKQRELAKRSRYRVPDFAMNRSFKDGNE